jgi:hypothetical protein
MPPTRLHGSELSHMGNIAVVTIICRKLRMLSFWKSTVTLLIWIPCFGEYFAKNIVTVAQLIKIFYV